MDLFSLPLKTIFETRNSVLRGLGAVYGHFVPWSDRSKSDRSNQ